jgi:hypothetical protein
LDRVIINYLIEMLFCNFFIVLNSHALAGMHAQFILRLILIFFKKKKINSKLSMLS